jgi:phosphoribosyl-ATP pyrophosphohydrolase
MSGSQLGRWALEPARGLNRTGPQEAGEAQHASTPGELAALNYRHDGRSPTARMVAEFHEAIGQTYGDGGSGSNALRIELHDEEHNELRDELIANNRLGIAHELADLVYVAFGTAFSLGIPLDAVIAEVHQANMTKRDPETSKFELNAAGKVLKGHHFVPPNIAAVLGLPADQQ